MILPLTVLRAAPHGGGWVAHVFPGATGWATQPRLRPDRVVDPFPCPGGAEDCSHGCSVGAASAESGPDALALLYAHLRQKEEAFTLLQTAFDRKSPFIFWAFLSPDFDPWNDDDAFINLANKLTGKN